MKKCFLCGKEYDEKNKKALIEVSYRLQACPSCVRAGMFFIALKMQLEGKTCYTNIKPVYEDDENVANQTTPVIADVKSDEK